MGQALAYTPDDLREFLLQTSVSEFLDAELAEKLTGRSDSALLLERAHVQPGFLNRQSERRWPYRYHPMFRALLLAELMGVASGEVRRLSALAANGLPAMASMFAPRHWLFRVSHGGCFADSILAGAVCRPRDRATGVGFANAFGAAAAVPIQANLSVRLASILAEGGNRRSAGGYGLRAGIAEREYPGRDTAGSSGDHIRQGLVGRRARVTPGLRRVQCWRNDSGGEVTHGSAAALRGLRPPGISCTRFVFSSMVR